LTNGVDRKEWSGVTLAWASAILNSFAPLCATLGFSFFNSSAVALLTAIFGALFAKLIEYKTASAKCNIRILLPCAFIHGLGFILMFSCLHLVGPVTFALLSRLYIINTTLLAYIVLREHISTRDFILIVLGIIGGFLWVGPVKSEGSLIGAVLGLLYGFCFAYANVRLTQIARSATVSTFSIVFVNYVVAFWLILPIVIYSGLRTPSAKHVASSIFFIILGAALSTVSLSFMYQSFKRMSFAKSNLIRSASSVIGALIAWPLYPRELSVASLIGGSLLLISVALISKPYERR
jgi:drug/metabolite transporter (DMT)-like permease